MKLHTKLTENQVYGALNDVKTSQLMTPDVFAVQMKYEGSRTHAHGYLIQLGTYDQTSGPTNSRRYKNTGQWGASSGYVGEQIWAATWDEWGWFIAAIFKMDPDARFGNYQNAEHFHNFTSEKFTL